MKYLTKLFAGSDLQVFTKRGFAGMDTLYVADSDSSFLKTNAHDILATSNYNKQFGESTSSYKEINAIKKGEIIKEVIGRINLRKTDSGWVKIKYDAAIKKPMSATKVTYKQKDLPSSK